MKAFSVVFVLIHKISSNKPNPSQLNDISLRWLAILVEFFFLFLLL